MSGIKILIAPVSVHSFSITLTGPAGSVVEHQLRDWEVVKNGTSGYLAWCSAL